MTTPIIGAQDKVTGFAYYKGHVIDLTQTGNPQTQNVWIDGKSVGYVTFPQSGFQAGRSIIDAREELS